MSLLQNYLSAPAYRQLQVEKLKRLARRGATVPADWPSRLALLFPEYTARELGGRHAAVWEWADRIELSEPVDPLIAIWPRESGKSTTAEMISVDLGARRKRKYAIYVSAIQDQADKHVATVAGMMMSRNVARYFPELAEPRITSNGGRTWNRKMIVTASGYVVEAIGLNKAVRGQKIDWARPDLIIIDDIDERHDTAVTTQRKEEILTTSIFPSGSREAAILMAQNLVHANGVFARLSDGRARYLINRQVSGPFPAVEGLETASIDGRDVIVAGTPTWDGQDLEVCQRFIDTWGLEAFLRECQHDVYSTGRNIFKAETWANGRNRYDPDGAWLDDLLGIYITIDTAFKDKTTSDLSAAMVWGLTKTYQLLLLDAKAERIQSAYLPSWIEDIAVKWNGRNLLKEVVIEDKGSGITAGQSLRATAEPWLAHIIREFQPNGTKEYRARNASVWCGRDCIILPDPHPSNREWYAALLDEELGQLYRFPFAANDDMVDTFTMIILYLEHFLERGWRERSMHWRPVLPGAPGKQHGRVTSELAKLRRKHRGKAHV